MNKKSSQKLSLSTTTLRNLGVNDLLGVAGGLWKPASEACGSGVPGCSAKCTSNVHLTCQSM